MPAQDLTVCPKCKIADFLFKRPDSERLECDACGWMAGGDGKRRYTSPAEAAMDGATTVTMHVYGDPPGSLNDRCDVIHPRCDAIATHYVTVSAPGVVSNFLGCARHAHEHAATYSSTTAHAHAVKSASATLREVRERLAKFVPPHDDTTPAQANTEAILERFDVILDDLQDCIPAAVYPAEDSVAQASGQMYDAEIDIDLEIQLSDINVVRCGHPTRSGRPCKNVVVAGTDYCNAGHPTKYAAPAR